MRGTPEQVALAAWLVAQLDAPGVQGGTRESPGSNATGEVARIFYLTNATNPFAINEIGIALLKVAAISMRFSLQEKNAIALQATPADANLAEWLIRALDRPPGRREAITYVIPGDRDDQVRIIYESKAFRPRIEPQILSSLRSFQCNSAQALIVRGTSEQLATAQQSINSR